MSSTRLRNLSRFDPHYQHTDRMEEVNAEGYPIEDTEGSISEGKSSDFIAPDDGLGRLFTPLELFTIVLPGVYTEYFWTIGEIILMPYLLDLRTPVSVANLLWLANPLFGLLIQPVVGALTDRCRSSWGRRRPFIFALMIMCTLGFVLMILAPNITMSSDEWMNVMHILSTTEHVEESGGDSDSSLDNLLVPGTCILLTFIAYGISDMGSDLILIPSRALVNDVVPQQQRPLANTMFSTMGGLGRLIALGLTFAPLWMWPDFLVNLYHDPMYPDVMSSSLQLRLCFTASIFAAIFLLGPVLCIHERPLVDEEAVEAAKADDTAVRTAFGLKPMVEKKTDDIRDPNRSGRDFYAISMENTKLNDQMNILRHDQDEHVMLGSESESASSRQRLLRRKLLQSRRKKLASEQKKTNLSNQSYATYPSSRLNQEQNQSYQADSYQHTDSRDHEQYDQDHDHDHEMGEQSPLVPFGISFSQIAGAGQAQNQGQGQRIGIGQGQGSSHTSSDPRMTSMGYRDAYDGSLEDVLGEVHGATTDYTDYTDLTDFTDYTDYTDYNDEEGEYGEQVDATGQKDFSSNSNSTQARKKPSKSEKSADLLRRILTADPGSMSKSRDKLGKQSKGKFVGSNNGIHGEADTDHTDYTDYTDFTDFTDFTDGDFLTDTGVTDVENEEEELVETEMRMADELRRQSHEARGEHSLVDHGDVESTREGDGGYVSLTLPYSTSDSYSGNVSSHQPQDYGHAVEVPSSHSTVHTSSLSFPNPFTELVILYNVFRNMPLLLIRTWFQAVTMWYNYMLVVFWWTAFCSQDILKTTRMQEGIALGTIAHVLCALSMLIVGSFLIPYLNRRFGVRLIFHASCFMFVVVVLLISATPLGSNKYSATLLFAMLGVSYPVLTSNPYLIASRYFSPECHSIAKELRERRDELFRPSQAMLEALRLNQMNRAQSRAISRAHSRAQSQVPSPDNSPPMGGYNGQLYDFDATRGLLDTENIHHGDYDTSSPSPMLNHLASQVSTQSSSKSETTEKNIEKRTRDMKDIIQPSTGSLMNATNASKSLSRKSSLNVDVDREYAQNLEHDHRTTVASRSAATEPHFISSNHSNLSNGFGVGTRKHGERQNASQQGDGLSSSTSFLPNKGKEKTSNPAFGSTSTSGLKKHDPSLQLERVSSNARTEMRAHERAHRLAVAANAEKEVEAEAARSLAASLRTTEKLSSLFSLEAAKRRQKAFKQKQRRRAVPQLMQHSYSQSQTQSQPQTQRAQSLAGRRDVFTSVSPTSELDRMDGTTNDIVNYTGNENDDKNDDKNDDENDDENDPNNVNVNVNDNGKNNSNDNTTYNEGEFGILSPLQNQSPTTPPYTVLALPSPSVTSSTRHTHTQANVHHSTCAIPAQDYYFRSEKQSHGENCKPVSTSRSHTPSRGGYPSPFSYNSNPSAVDVDDSVMTSKTTKTDKLKKKLHSILRTKKGSEAVNISTTGMGSVTVNDTGIGGSLDNESGTSSDLDLDSDIDSMIDFDKNTIDSDENRIVSVASGSALQRPSKLQQQHSKQVQERLRSKAKAKAKAKAKEKEKKKEKTNTNLLGQTSLSQSILVDTIDYNDVDSDVYHVDEQETLNKPNKPNSDLEAFQASTETHESRSPPRLPRLIGIRSMPSSPLLQPIGFATQIHRGGMDNDDINEARAREDLERFSLAHEHDGNQKNNHDDDDDDDVDVDITSASGSASGSASDFAEYDENLEENANSSRSSVKVTLGIKNETTNGKTHAVNIPSENKVHNVDSETNVVLPSIAGTPVYDMNSSDTDSNEFDSDDATISTPASRHFRKQHGVKPRASRTSKYAHSPSSSVENTAFDISQAKNESENANSPVTESDKKAIEQLRAFNELSEFTPQDYLARTEGDEEHPHMPYVPLLTKAWSSSALHDLKVEAREAAKEAREAAFRSKTDLMELSVERLATREDVVDDEDSFGQVAAIMTMSMTLGQVIMGFTAGVLIEISGSLSNAFFITIVLLLLVQLAVLMMDLKTWDFDETVARVMDTRRKERKRKERMLEHAERLGKQRKEHAQKVKTEKIEGAILAAKKAKAKAKAKAREEAKLQKEKERESVIKKAKSKAKAKAKAKERAGAGAGAGADTRTQSGMSNMGQIGQQ